MYIFILFIYFFNNLNCNKRSSSFILSLMLVNSLLGLLECVWEGLLPFPLLTETIVQRKQSFGMYWNHLTHAGLSLEIQRQSRD
jgi:hypothetical protein